MRIFTIIDSCDEKLFLVDTSGKNHSSNRLLGGMATCFCKVVGLSHPFFMIQWWNRVTRGHVRWCKDESSKSECFQSNGHACF